MVLHRIRDTPDAPAFLYPRDPEWKTLSWRETGERVRAIASGLRAIGVHDEERVAILSATRIEWILADLGIVCAGAATTTIYPANSVEELAYILDDSRAVAVFVETPELLLRLLARRSELPNLKHVILFDGDPAPDDWVMSLDALEARGREHAASRPEFEATLARSRAAVAT
jgi:long-chain acyl-CoA synthetase